MAKTDTGTPRIGSGWIPRSAELLRNFRDQKDPEGVPDGFLATAARLHQLHRRQWAAEDSCRQAVTDEALAAEKRRIDAMNAARVALIGDLDDQTLAVLPAASDELPLHTETVGSIVDRLAISWIRAQVARTAGGDREVRAQRQLTELATAYDTLLDELENHRRRVPGWRTMKIYDTRSA